MKNKKRKSIGDSLIFFFYMLSLTDQTKVGVINETKNKISNCYFIIFNGRTS